MANYVEGLTCIGQVFKSISKAIWEYILYQYHTCNNDLINYHVVVLRFPLSLVR
jgi:hypothetical protein